MTTNPRHYKKMGYNCAEKQLFSKVSEVTGLDGCRHPLSYVLEAADDMAYRTSDLEDAMVKKVLTLSQITEGLHRYEAELARSGVRGKRQGAGGAVCPETSSAL